MGWIDFWSLIVRQKFMILIVFISIMLISVLFLFIVDPIYQASCKVLLVDEQDVGMAQDFVLKDFMMHSLGNSDPILTQIEILKSRPVIEETVRICDVRNDKGELIDADQMLGKFQFEHIASTNVIKITCKENSSTVAAVYANTLAKVFLKRNQHLNREKVINIKRFLENQLVVQKENLDEAERNVIDYKTRSNTVSLGEQTSMRVTALAELEAERVRLESELRGLQAQKAEIDRRLAGVGSQAIPGYSSLNNAREQINISITSVNARLRGVRVQMVEKYRDMKDIPLLEIQLAKLEREEAIAKEIYTNLLVKYEEYKIREAGQVGSIQIVEPATPDDTPIFPKKKEGVALAAFAGLFLGLSIAFTFEYLKDRPYNVGEIKKILKTTTLGVLPFLRKESVLFMKNNPRSAPSDAMRLIVTNLKYKKVDDREHLAFMVTSSQSGEGKSVTAANLAVAFASQGKKTVLVNLDLRRPTFNRLFGRKFNIGLTEYLISEASMNQISWCADFISNLVVISSGKVPPNPTELIVSSKMESFVKEVKSIFDVVIFDTAPVTMVAETLEIARKNIDGLILVADMAGTSRRGLVYMKSILEDKNLPVMGVVINKVENTVEGKYSTYAYAYSNQA